MFKWFLNYISGLYCVLLRIFFEFDIVVNEYKSEKINIKKELNIKYNLPVLPNKLKEEKIKVKTKRFKKTKPVMHIMPSFLSQLLIRNQNQEFFHFLKLHSENLTFLAVVKDYCINFLTQLHISAEYFILKSKAHKSLKKEIQISRKLKTIDEIIELEPYTNSIDTENVRYVPVIKYPVKKEKFTDLQLENMKTKLAIFAKCKKFSIILENIYDKIPDGLYSEFEVNRDNTLKCTFEKEPVSGDMQILVTGKRKYDTQMLKVLVNYSDLGLN